MTFDVAAIPFAGRGGAVAHTDGGTSRRTVLGGAAALGVALALGGLPTGTANAAVSGPRRAAFTRLLGATVTVSGQGARVAAVVESVDDLVGAPAGHPAAYSVILRPVTEGALGQETYAVRHDRLAVNLFLVPIGREGQIRYQAVINQLRYSTSGVPT